MKAYRIIALTGMLALATSPLSAALAETKSSAEMKDAGGASLGTLNLSQEGKGVRITGRLTGLVPGTHAFHIHETGACEPPFKSAGGHFNPTGAKHGKVDGGSHAGDMENIEVMSDGTVTIDVVNEKVTLEKAGKSSLFDDDGSALVIHAKGDDYESQPAGAAGDRVACGVVE